MVGVTSVADSGADVPDPDAPGPESPDSGTPPSDTPGSDVSRPAPTEPEDFDAIVRRLGIHLSFPDDAEVPGTAPTHGPAQGAARRRDDDGLPAELAEAESFDDMPDPVDEQFYRRVQGGPTGPVHRGRALAWIGLVGTPLLLVLATLAGSWLSSSVLLGAGVTFVASAIYLISQLPEHGPAQPDWPDDGAEL